jgi:hypothetical protein
MFVLKKTQYDLNTRMVQLVLDRMSVRTMRVYSYGPDRTRNIYITTLESWSMLCGRPVVFSTNKTDHN